MSSTNVLQKLHLFPVCLVSVILLRSCRMELIAFIKVSGQLGFIFKLGSIFCVGLNSSVASNSGHMILKEMFKANTCLKRITFSLSEPGVRVSIIYEVILAINKTQHLHYIGNLLNAV